MPSEPISAEDRVRNEVRDNGAPASSMISRKAATRIAEEHAAAAVDFVARQRDYAIEARDLAYIAEEALIALVNNQRSQIIQAYDEIARLKEANDAK